MPQISPAPINELKAFALNSENSTTDLTAREEQAIALIEKRYKDIFLKRGEVAGIFNDIKNYLRVKFKRVPQNDLLFDVFHTVYRYLFPEKENHWISPKALYAKRDAQGNNISAAISWGGTNLIAYLWLIAEDENFPKPTGHTEEAFKDFLINHISLIARAHNWDETRPRLNSQHEEILDTQGNIVTEYYDDGGLDNPRCIGGVMKDLSQILNFIGYPILDEAVIKSHYYSHIISGAVPDSLFSRIDSLSSRQAEKISAVLYELVVENEGDINKLSDSNQETLKFLAIFPAQLDAFRKLMEKKFGVEQMTDTAQIKPRFANISFNTYGEFTKFFGDQSLSIFYKELSEKLKKRSAESDLESVTTPPPTLLMSSKGKITSRFALPLKDNWAVVPRKVVSRYALPLPSTSGTPAPVSGDKESVCSRSRPGLFR